MNRRAFLRYVGTGLVVGPAAVKAILAAAPAEAAVGPLAPWTGVQWWVKEFDWGNKLGVAMGVTNPKTGKTVRNAVRLILPRGPDHDAFMDRVVKATPTRDFGEGLATLPDPTETVRAAQMILEMWAEEESYRQGLVQPPAWWRRSRTTPGIPLDEVLEGKEMRL